MYRHQLLGFIACCVCVSVGCQGELDTELAAENSEAIQNVAESDASTDVESQPADSKGGLNGTAQNRLPNTSMPTPQKSKVSRPMFYSTWAPFCTHVSNSKSFGTGSVCYFPETPSDFVLIGEEVFNVRTRKLVGSIPSSGAIAALSPSGTRAAMSIGKRTGDYLIKIYDTVTGKEQTIINARRDPAVIDWFGFLDDQRLAVIWNRWPDRNQRIAIQIWNANTGENIKAFGADLTLGLRSKPTTNGRYLSIADFAGKLVICDLDAESPHFQQMEFVASLPANTRVSAVSFNEPGTEIVTRFHTHHERYPDAGVLVGNLNTLRFDSNVPFLPMPNRLVSPFWQSSGTELLIDGSTLVDIESGKRILVVPSYLQMTFDKGDSRSRIFGNSLLLMLPTGGFSVTPLPLDKIRKSLAVHNDPQSPAHLRSGDALSIVIEGCKRYEDTSWKSTAIERLTKMIKSAGLRVTQNAPIEFRLNLSEIDHGIYKMKNPDEGTDHTKGLVARNEAERQKIELIRKKQKQANKAMEKLLTRN